MPWRSGQCTLDKIEAGVDAACGIGIGRAELKSRLGAKAHGGCAAVACVDVGSERHSADGGKQEVVETVERAVIWSGQRLG